MSDTPPACSRCGGPRTQVSRPLLIVLGLALIVVAVMLPWHARWLVLPAVFPALLGGFLLLWGTLGKGLWCRACKSF